MTPAINLAKKLKISFTLHEYSHDANSESYGLEAAEKLQVDASQVFKTLVVQDEQDKLVKAQEYNKALKESKDYKDNIWNTDYENQKESNKLAWEDLETQKQNILATSNLTENKIEEYKAQRLANSSELSGEDLTAYDKVTNDTINKIRETANIEEKVKLENYLLGIYKQQNVELDQSVKKHSAITSAVMSLVENVASGKGMSFDISQVRDSAMKSFTKVASGKTAKTEDYLAMGSYVAGIVDQFSKSEFASKQQSLSWEQKILDLRLQGAKTEAEKLAIEKQQYELQVQALELSYQQQTSFIDRKSVV